ncbi:MAG: mercury transporter MerT [Acidobacteria bacterium]|nr:mercury transporter MerT [Acidobacteriota bacterium]
MNASKEGLTLGGALAAAVAASACCIGPVLFVALGLGGASFAVAIAPYRGWLVSLTLLLLGTAFYQIYRKPDAEDCDEDGACRTASRTRGLKVLLWITSAIVVGVLAFPYYAPYLF